MYRLYESVNSGSSAIEAALAETGVEFALTTVTTGQGMHLTEEYRKVNPRQQVPALVLPDGSVMTEGVAMLLHLADAFPEKRLAPPPGSTARAQHDRWLLFLCANVYEGELRKAYSDRYTDDPNGGKSVMRAAAAYVQRHYLLIEEAIGNGPYLFGDHFTMVDIYLWMLSYWMDQDWLATHCPKVARLAATVRMRPGIPAIHDKHFG